MRCSIGRKKIKRLEVKTGLSIVGAMVRGGNGHRIDLLLDDGVEVSLSPDGEIKNYGWKWRIWEPLREKVTVAGLLEHKPLSRRERIKYEMSK